MKWKVVELTSSLPTSTVCTSISVIGTFILSRIDGPKTEDTGLTIRLSVTTNSAGPFKNP
ncbi:hypothetical protein RchiOBHm_Chr5g0067421 [Rosa chinensis]|uniref:Uncharacterized protein n=1 Tax=Rosa chinensis TaxID=74649 RepID=A0A2P6QJG9_ROSCH|nr:hypothetical protein RchiOBHm_Chr5g0067421 [Rosa chinensis]